MKQPPTTQVPEIAILGHPNEGKSSVLSTLAEDDSVRISDTPGETIVCRTFPVSIDNREVLRFTDTPGFQNPLRVLAELQELSKQPGDCISAFRKLFSDFKDLYDDIELLAPVERGAGIIYVVDGSRPVRNVDRAEMEILRLSGRPRMAIINCKENKNEHLSAWKNEFRRNFNANRVFNAHRATYAERILLFEALKSIDQDWQPILTSVVDAFREDWDSRNRQTVEIVLDLLSESLAHSVSAPLNSESAQDQTQQHLLKTYRHELSIREKKAHDRIRRLFKHNIFNYTLPPHSLLNEELFSKKSWQMLGLSRTQVAVLGGLGGAAIGAGIDLAAGGALLGLVTGLAGAVGAVGALWGSRRLSRFDVLGIRLGGETIQIGPAQDINMLFVLINRALLFYRHTINWAHGRRDYDLHHLDETVKAPYMTTSWSTGRLRSARAFFSAATGNSTANLHEHRAKLGDILYESLLAISEDKEAEPPD